MKCCWATLLSNDAYLPGLVVMATTLKRVTKYPLLVLLVKSNCSDLAITVCQQLGCKVVFAEKIDFSTQYDKIQFPQFAEVWTKLRVWQLAQYDRIVYLDCDMLVTQSMDELFTIALPRNPSSGRSGIASGCACTCNPRNTLSYPTNWKKESCIFRKGHWHLDSDQQMFKNDVITINSGLIVLQPSQKTYDEMIEWIVSSDRTKDYYFPDQDFLQDFYANEIRVLPYMYNGLRSLTLAHPGYWRSAEVKNIHYLYIKPWQVSSGESLKDLDKVWWTAFLHGTQHWLHDDTKDAVFMKWVQKHRVKGDFLLRQEKSTHSDGKGNIGFI